MVLSVHCCLFNIIYCEQFFQIARERAFLFLKRQERVRCLKLETAFLPTPIKTLSVQAKGITTEARQTIMLSLVQRFGEVRFGGLIITGAIMTLMLLSAVLVPSHQDPKNIRVAFIGNSMMYYNDLPRFMEALAGGDGSLRQNSCLHGGASFTKILLTGNGMYGYDMWSTGAARIRANSSDSKLYDYGACTVRQLLLGYDSDLDERVSQIEENGADGGDDDNNNDDYWSFDDGMNPCLQDPDYLTFLNDEYASNGPPVYDFAVINDNTRAPARYYTRQESLTTLQEVYIPLFSATNVIPVLMFTFGYWTPYRDMSGLEDVPTFTSLTAVGYQAYADLLAEQMPASQQPRIAPVGLAFLTVWEENYAQWLGLFHVDMIHPNLAGTFLEGCVLYHTLTDQMPDYNHAVRKDLSALWNRARRFQPREHRRSAFPTQEVAAYLYE